MKRFLLLFLLGLVGVGGYLAYRYSQGTGGRNVYNFIPSNYVFLIESDEPISDWKEVSKSAMWQELKKSSYFGDLTKSANRVDSLLAKNQKLTELASIGKLLISTHVISKENYEFLIALDLNDKGKLSSFQTILSPLFRTMGYQVSNSKIYNFDCLHLYDSKDKSTLHLSLVDNVLLASYHEPLLKSGLAQLEQPSIEADSHFQQAYKSSIGTGSYSLIVHYSYVDAFIRLFSDSPSEMVLGLQEALAYSGFTLSTSANDSKLLGSSILRDSSSTYLLALADAGVGTINASSVLPSQTVLYSSIGFSDFPKFYKNLQETYAKQNEDSYKEMKKTQEQMEKYLKISIEKDLFGWVKEEVCTAIVGIPSENETIKYANYALLHFDKKDYLTVKDRLDYIEKQIRKKTPLRFDTELYNGYEIHYLEMKGLFKIFFKKLFANIEKPHYVILDDYVIFSNDVPSLKYIVDSYLSDNLLSENSAYKSFRGKFDRKGTALIYLDVHNLLPYIKEKLDADSRQKLVEQEIAFKSFPRIGFELKPNGVRELRNTLYMQVEEWHPVTPPSLSPDFSVPPDTSTNEL